jgi:hypothetical protein
MADNSDKSSSNSENSNNNLPKAVDARNGNSSGQAFNKSNADNENARRIAMQSVGKQPLRSNKAAPGGNLPKMSEETKAAVGKGAVNIAEKATVETISAVDPIVGKMAGAALKLVKPADLLTGKGKIKLILFVVSLFLILMFFSLAVIAGSASSSVDSSSNGSFGVINPEGGGFPVLEQEQKDNAIIIMETAANFGLNSDAATAGLVAALTVADLKNKFHRNPGAMTPVGIFGFTPYEWAPQFWTGVEYKGEGWNDAERIRQSVEYLEDPRNSSELFFRTFNTSRLLSGDKWKNRSSWDLAKIVRENRSKDWQAAGNDDEEVPAELREGDDEDTRWRPNIYDSSMYSAQSGRALSTLFTIYVENSEWASKLEGFWGEMNIINAAAFYGGGNFTLAPVGERKFTDGPVIYPKTAEALARAQLFVANPQFVCSDAWFDTSRGLWQGCKAKCDHLAGDIWGYWYNSGYWDAKYHWGVALSQGIARPGNRVPPIGSLLFWDTGPQGHVATYIGNGQVVSNLTNGPNGTSIYVVPAEFFENEWGSPYLGWADPVFRGNPAGEGPPGVGLPNKVMCSSANDTQRALCQQQSGETLRQWGARS